MRARRRLLLCCLLPALLAWRGAGAAETLTSVGSDTLGELLQAWARRYAQEQPQLRLQIQTPGSAGAAPALASGAADLGPMSRAMNAAEEADYRRRRGQAPGRVRIAYDAVAVFVHPDNPVTGLSLAQLAQIWAADPACAAAAPAQRWGDLAAAGAGADQPLLRLGRNTASGTYEFFHSAALCDGPYRADVVQFPGAGTVVAAVARQPNAIGYSGLAHLNGLVRVLPLRRGPGEAAVAPDAPSVISGRYPLSRSLYLYFNRAADGRPDAKTAAFLRFALSAKGQELVSRQGFIALPAAEVNTELGQLQ
ncbi:PstS family phosphate ABC transporter substrate-binding protein [Tahibacter harae]|uniref:Phosphate ABC transporter substrate-binding protein n=1 Tax=Tahibacter harae TaxID=2963937 RepID=A0ABT1QXZ5_9GAMM|nr:phosphate ABC transporter substrate-binding protein [Tahibacter harae]MCQ4167169.1 phosphate ABC transporter substrate-binding protein [Tahibacter harae]